MAITHYQQPLLFSTRVYHARYRGLGAYVDPVSDIGQVLCVFDSWSSFDHAHRQFLETSDCPNADPGVRE
jgi:hypothetical protein